MPLSSAEPFLNVHTMKIINVSCCEADCKEDGERICRKRARESKLDRFKWRCDGKRMTPILIIDFWNQMLQTKEPNVKKKKNKEKKKEKKSALANYVER